MRVPEVLALDIKATTDKEIDKKSLSTHRLLAVHYAMEARALKLQRRRTRTDCSTRRYVSLERALTTMYSTVNLLFALIIGSSLGVVAGWYLAMNARGDNKRKRILDLESQLDQAAQSRADYEAGVSEHFAKTADLLHKLTDDYRAVYTHLAEGAEQLCGDQVNMAEAALNSPDTEAKPHLVEVAQPLDYAPKKPDEQGQLSETFGLDKSNTSAA